MKNYMDVIFAPNVKEQGQGLRTDNLHIFYVLFVIDMLCLIEMCVHRTSWYGFPGIGIGLAVLPVVVITGTCFLMVNMKNQLVPARNYLIISQMLFVGINVIRTESPVMPLIIFGVCAAFLLYRSRKLIRVSTSYAMIIICVKLCLIMGSNHAYSGYQDVLTRLEDYIITFILAGVFTLILNMVASKYYKAERRMQSMHQDMLAQQDEMEWETNKIKEDVASGAKEADNMFEYVKNSIEQLMSEISIVNHDSDQVIALMHEESHSIELLSTKSQQMEEQKSALTETSEKIQTFSNELVNHTKTMLKVANEINLLALHASIEASRAGNLGCDTAIEAQGLHALAIQVSDAIGTINQKLKLFEQESNKAFGVMNSTIEDSDSQSKFILEISGHYSEVEEHAADISRSVTAIGSIVQEISDDSAQVSTYMQRLTSISMDDNK